VFEVSLTYDADASYDNGACASSSTDHTYRYGYTPDYQGYGAWMFDLDGSYVYWGSAEFDGDRAANTGTFSYFYGYRDYEYRGKYYTYYQLGTALIE
jgi:hypothetical protein